MKPDLPNTRQDAAAMFREILVHRRRAISCVADKLSACQDKLSSMELIYYFGIIV
jgi:hypothetical protein